MTDIERFRDFRNESDAIHADPILAPKRSLVNRALSTSAGRALSLVGGNRLEDGDFGQRWGFEDGDGHQAVIQVKDIRALEPVLMRYGDVGLFYSYTGDAGPLWKPDTEATVVPKEVDTGNPDVDTLVPVVEALFKATTKLRNPGRQVAKLFEAPRDYLAKRNWDPSTTRTKDEIRTHYDLQQDVYTGEYGFLDPQYVQYSSGLLRPGERFKSLEQLQKNKIDSIERKLELDGAQTLLEVGGGWGGLAVELALRNPQLHITSLTVSDEQLRRARERAVEEGVDDRVTFVGQDYRDFEPEKPFDKVVSIEMIEAVDWRDLDTYFAHLDRFADPDNGVVVIQSINVKDRQHAQQKHSKSFANTAIFPGGVLTTTERMAQGMGDLGWDTHEATDLTPSYAFTLREWIRNMCENRQALTDTWMDKGIDPVRIDRFYRGFSFYLAASQAGFRPTTDNIQGWQQTYRRR